MSDFCPCGAEVVLTSIMPDTSGWEGRCDAGHRVFLTDLSSPPVLLSDAEAELV